MFRESLLDKILYRIKKFIPKSVFEFFQPAYHTLLAYLGAMRYGFPSRSMKVIGITGTKGKSTTTYLISKVLESAGYKVAAIGSLGYKILDKEWPNTLKMTMPGRFRMQKFLKQAKNASCQYVVLEVTSEGIKQKRHIGIDFDCAVFTNLHREHIESHGSFENYLAAKQELFKKTKNIHIINADDIYAEQFKMFPSKSKVFFGLRSGDLKPESFEAHGDHSMFTINGQEVNIHFGGEFNVLNALAALAVGQVYGVSAEQAAGVLEKVNNIPGRMEFVKKGSFNVVVDYAHTPDSLRHVYSELKKESQRLICVLGAAGGGRDRWKRPEFGTIADEYCDKIFLTDEDPFEENPDSIVAEVNGGIKDKSKVRVIMERKEAIGAAMNEAQSGDTVIITGKGSETSMAISGGRKIPWSDKQIVLEFQ